MLIYFWFPTIDQASRNFQLLRLIRFNSWQRTTGLIFSPGAAVEVTLHGQHDAWFPAIVCREIGLGSYVVQCQSLKNSGETGVLDVTVDNLHIRPSPPRLEGRKFGLLEKVDAFYDYGWWNGIVTKVLTGRRYVVFFKHTNMEKEFIHSDLRPHMEWVDGKWVGATQVRVILLSWPTLYFLSFPSTLIFWSLCIDLGLIISY